MRNIRKHLDINQPIALFAQLPDEHPARLRPKILDVGYRINPVQDENIICTRYVRGGEFRDGGAP